MGRVGRGVTLAVGILLAQCLLYGPSLFGPKILLPLDLLAREGVYLPRTPETDAIVAHDAVFSDEIEQMEVFRQFAVAEVRQGRLPLWNPYNYCGAPFLAANQTAVFSPFRLPDYLFPGPRTLAWVYLLKALVAGAGAYLFFRRALAASFWPACFGAWAYPLSGFLVLWAGYPLSSAALWLPWVLLGVDAAARRPRGRGGLGLALAVALTLLSGHLGVSGHVLLAAGLYAAFLLARSADVRAAGAGALALGAGLLLGIALAAPQVLPTVEYLGSSRRVSDRLQVGGETPAAGIAALPLLARPDFHGSSRRGQLMLTEINQLESAAGGYAGFFTLLLLAPLAFFRARTRPQAAFFLGLAVFSLGQVLELPLVAWLLGETPLRLLRNNRLVLVAGFAVLALAVTGLEALREGAARRSRLLALPALALVGFGWLSAARAAAPPALVGEGLADFVSRPENAGALPPSLRTLADARAVQRWFLASNLESVALCALGLGLLGLVAWRPLDSRLAPALAAVALAEMVATNLGVHPQADPALYFPRIPALEAIARADDGRVCGYRCLPPNLNLSHRLRDVRGYDAADPSALVDLLELARDPRQPAPLPHARTQGFVPRPSPILRLMGVRYLIARGAPPAGVEPAFSSPDYWVLRQDALPRAFVPRHVERVAAGPATLERMGRADFDPAELALVDDAAGLVPGPSAGSVRIASETPGRVRIEAQMETAGLVVLSDLHFPGWRAELDGRAAVVVKANHAFRGVVVPAGRHSLEYRYEPSSFAWGLRSLGLGLALAGGWALAARRA